MWLCGEDPVGSGEVGDSLGATEAGQVATVADDAAAGFEVGEEAAGPDGFVGSGAQGVVDDGDLVMR